MSVSEFFDFFWDTLTNFYNVFIADSSSLLSFFIMVCMGVFGVFATVRLVMEVIG